MEVRDCAASARIGLTKWARASGSCWSPKPMPFTAAVASLFWKAGVLAERRGKRDKPVLLDEVALHPHGRDGNSRHGKAD